MEFIPGGIFTEDRRDFSLEKTHKLLGSSSLYPDDMMITQIPQVWQKSYPACGSHAGVHLKEVQEFIETGKQLRLSPAYLWKKIKQIDGFDPNIGTDMRSIFKCLAKDGICDYDLLPNEYNQSLDEYTDPSVITPKMDDNAQPRIISSYAFCTDLSIENIKHQIWLNKTMLLLIQCDNGFFHTDTPTFTSRPYGHFVTAIGYNKYGILIEDSTEIAHPIKLIKNEYAPYIIQAGTCIDLPDDIVNKLTTKIGLMQRLIDLYKQLLKK